MNSEEAVVVEDTDQQVNVPRGIYKGASNSSKPMYFSEEQYSSTQNDTRKQHGDGESSSISKGTIGEESVI